MTLESPFFVLYLTNLEGSFLAAFNDHDFAIIDDPNDVMDSISP